MKIAARYCQAAHVLVQKRSCRQRHRAVADGQPLDLGESLTIVVLDDGDVVREKIGRGQVQSFVPIEIARRNGP
jgi:hypothetical protein